MRINRFNYPFADFAPTFLEILDEHKVDQGNAILSKFPIVDHNVTFFNEPYGKRLEIPENFPTTPRNLEHAVLDTGSNKLNIFNFQGVWDLNGEKVNKAMRDIEAVCLDGDISDHLPQRILFQL